MLDEWNPFEACDLFLQFFSCIAEVETTSSLLKLDWSGLDAKLDNGLECGVAAFIISCLWIYALTWACLPVMGWTAHPDNPVVQNGFCYFGTDRAYNITVNIVNFLLPMIFMAIFWSFIYSIVHQHRKRVLKIERSLSLNTNDSSNSSNNINANGEGHPMTHLAPKNEKRERKRIRRNVRGCRYLGFIVVLFYFCWLPYVTASMIGNLCTWCNAQGLIPYVLYDALLALGFMNSALNPFLYPFHDKHFKEAFRDMWKKMASKTFVKLLSRREKVLEMARVEVAMASRTGWLRTITNNSNNNNNRKNNNNNNINNNDNGNDNNNNNNNRRKDQQKE